MNALTMVLFAASALAVNGGFLHAGYGAGLHYGVGLGYGIAGPIASNPAGHAAALQVHAGQVAAQKAVTGQQIAAYGLDLPYRLAPIVKVHQAAPIAINAGSVAIQASNPASHAAALQVHAGQVAAQKAVIGQQIAAYGLDLPYRLAPLVKVHQGAPIAISAAPIAIASNPAGHAAALHVHAKQVAAQKAVTGHQIAAYGLDLPYRLAPVLNLRQW